MRLHRLFIGLGAVFGCTIDMSGPNGGTSGPGGGYTPPPCTSSSPITLSSSADTIDAGRSIVLFAYAPFSSWCVGSWRSSDTGIVAQASYRDENSLFGPTFSAAFRGRAPGAATITGTVGPQSASASLTIVPARTTFIAASPSAGFVCALDAGGRAYCFGNDPYPSVSPTRVPGDSVYQSIAAGRFRACGITPSGSALCWGWIWNGAQPWARAGVLHGSPVALSSTDRFLAIDGGEEYHDCGLTVDSAAACWGDNSAGQFGNGLVGGDVTSQPQRASGNHHFAQVSAGGWHTCALTAAGDAWCWGSATLGQLGNGGYGVGSTIPVQVNGGLKFRSISAGEGSTCGLTLEGAAWCWGANGQGQLGTGDTLGSAVPRAVSGSLTFGALSVGYGLACGMASAGGVYCWGSVYSNPQGDKLVPTPIVSPVALTWVRTGGNTVCGGATDNRLYCWGWGIFGGTLDGSTGTPTRVSGQR